MIFFDGDTVMSINANGTVRVGLPAFLEAEDLLKKAGIKACILAAEIYLQDSPTKVQPIQQVVSILRQPSSKAELSRLGLAFFDIIDVDGGQTGSTAEVYKHLNKWFGKGKKAHAAESVEAGSLDKVAELFKKWVTGEGSEGVVLRNDRAGWFKIKSRHNLDVAIIGFSEGLKTAKRCCTICLSQLCVTTGPFTSSAGSGAGLRRAIVRSC